MWRVAWRWARPRRRPPTVSKTGGRRRHQLMGGGAAAGGAPSALISCGPCFMACGRRGVRTRRCWRYHGVAATRRPPSGAAASAAASTARRRAGLRVRDAAFDGATGLRYHQQSLGASDPPRTGAHPPPRTVGPTHCCGVVTTLRSRVLSVSHAASGYHLRTGGAIAGPLPVQGPPSGRATLRCAEEGAHGILAGLPWPQHSNCGPGPSTPAMRKSGVQRRR